jgi:hypothetical protein
MKTPLFIRYRPLFSCPAGTIFHPPAAGLFFLPPGTASHRPPITDSRLLPGFLAGEAGFL